LRADALDPESGFLPGSSTLRRVNTIRQWDQVVPVRSRHNDELSGGVEHYIGQVAYDARDRRVATAEANAIPD
jgi:hypothetical protein